MVRPRRSSGDAVPHPETLYTNKYRFKCHPIPGLCARPLPNALHNFVLDKLILRSSELSWSPKSKSQKPKNQYVRKQDRVGSGFVDFPHVYYHVADGKEYACDSRGIFEDLPLHRQHLLFLRNSNVS